MVVDINSDRSENVKYDYPDFPVYVRRGRLSIYPNYAADSHWHDDIELICVLAGTMLYNVNGDVVTLHAGEGILVNTRQLHYGFSKDKSECVFICILFHPIILCTAKSFEREFVEPILHSGMPYVLLSPKEQWQSRMLEYIKGIYDCKDGREAPLCTQGYLCSFWSQLIGHTDVQAKGHAAADTKLSILKHMLDHIHRQYCEKITLADIAKAGNVSKRTCGILFNRYLNKTPVEFLIDYRMRKAVELLKSTDMTILEISNAVGFSGTSYFSETFRKYFGLSPTEFKKKERERAGYVSDSISGGTQ